MIASACPWMEGRRILAGYLSSLSLPGVLGSLDSVLDFQKEGYRSS